MITLSLSQLASILDAQLLGDGALTVENVSTDSRQSISKGLFFALKGEHFDAHHYLDKAAEQGCIAAVVEHQTNASIAQLVVKDTRLALGQLAKWLRKKINPKTVAMTGSSGKTTVKEMTATILQQSAVDFDDVLFTHGNFNNDIGVPLTLLRLTEQHKFAVIELGANHIGEIAYTTALAQPDVALVNNVAAAHLEGFGSLDGVATAKGEIYRALQLLISPIIINKNGRRKSVTIRCNILLTIIRKPIIMPKTLYFPSRVLLFFYIRPKAVFKFILLIWVNIMLAMPWRQLHWQ